MKVESAQEQALINQLCQDNIQFRRLLMQHDDLDKQVEKAQNGRFVVNTMELENLKKKKLRARDELERMLEQHRTAAA